MDVIATHSNADFDGLASMVAARKLYPDAKLIIPAGGQEALRNFLAVHDLGITKLKDVDLAQVTRLILVDTQEPDRITINALAVRLNEKGFGDVLDFYGGQRDLNDKVVRVLHGLSFVEDPTRVFRAVRFERRFGFHLGRDTAALIAGAVKMNLFHRLSGHRVLEELKLLLDEREPKHALQRLADLDLLKFIHPKLQWTDRLKALLDAIEQAVDWYQLLYLDRKMEPWLVYTMGLLEVLPERAVAEALKRFPFSEPETAKLKMARAGCHAVIRRLGGKTVLKPAEIYRLLSGLSDEVLLSLMAKSKGDSVKRQVSAFLTTYQHVKPTLTGADLKAMGLKPGPRFKQVLDQVLDARLNGEVKTEAEELDLVRRMTNLSV
ncbi:MAG: hypothetical protein HP492_11520 [Nitrospira sp.]|nr:hypothetical protein [Nitrospira sp.]